MSSPITFTSLARNIEIGANCYALDIGGHRVLLDAGMHPRAEEGEACPQFNLIPDDSADAIFLTHAHQDHLGCLPLAMRRHPRAPVFMTEATSRLGDVMLHNSVNVMSRRAEEGTARGVLFSHREVESAGRRWRPVPLRHRFDLTGERLRPDEEAHVACELHDAGHILGSCGVLLESEGRRVFYTGDVNFEDQTVMQAARFPDGPLDVLIIECTRGDHETAPGFTRRVEEERFAIAMSEVLAGGGCVFIPLFALGKTQEILTMIEQFRHKGVLPEVPVYIGGLSTKLTEIFDRLSGQSTRQRRDLKILDIEDVFTISGKEGFSTAIKPGRIYALSSGMMSENTLSNRLARQVLSEPRHGLFFVGYADPSSAAGRLLATPKGELFQLEPSAEPQALNCRVEHFAFSGHATRESIRAYVNRVQPKAVILVHGDPAAVSWMQTALQADLPGTPILSPPPGEPIVL